MKNPPDSVFTVDGVDVLATGEPGVFRYIPAARPETSGAGAPTLMLVKTPEGGLLQLGAQLSAEEAVLERIKAMLKSRQKQPGPIRLESAQLSVGSAKLLLESPAGSQELQQSTTAGLSPYTSLFRVTLNTAQTKAVEEVLAGKKGKLSVVYEVQLTGTASAHVQLEGNVTELLRELSPDSADEDALEQIERALSEKKLRATEEHDGTDTDSLVEQAWSAAKAKAAKMLLGYQNPALGERAKREDTLKSEVRLEEPRTITISRSTDIAEWFAGGRKATVLGPPGIPSVSSTAKAIKVSLGFEAKDTPLAFVEVQGTAPQPGVLRGPGFAPILLNAAGTLALRVHYSSNAPAFLNEVEAVGPERALNLEELGIAQVIVDASERKSAGAKKLTATVCYLRDGEEVENWPVRFQFGDWTEQWFVVTGAPDLHGSLKYQWQETGPDGSVTSQGPLTTDRTTIQIR